MKKKHQTQYRKDKIKYVTCLEKGREISMLPRNEQSFMRVKRKIYCMHRYPVTGNFQW